MIKLLTILSLAIPLTSFSQTFTEKARKSLIRELANPADSIYIEDRKQLERITGHSCKDSTVTFNYTSKTGDKIEINIQNGRFEPSKHAVDVSEPVYKTVNGVKRVDSHLAKNLIDGRYSYGIDGSVPRRETKAFSVKWNGVQLSIPDTAFSNLYELHFCGVYLPIEAYLTKNNKHLYIYIHGSDAAGSYAVKLVFDREKYVTRLIGFQEGFDFLDGTWKPDE